MAPSLDSLIQNILAQSPGMTEGEVRAEVSALAAEAPSTEIEAAEAMLSGLTDSMLDASAAYFRSSTGPSGGGYIQNPPQPERAGDILYSPSVKYRVIEHGHSAIFSSLDTVVEAPGGSNDLRQVDKSTMRVKSGTVYQEVVNDSGNVLSATKRNAVIAWARSRIGDKYNKNFLNNTHIASGTVGSSSNKQNCSQLVWAAFKKEADIDFNEIGFVSFLSPAAYLADKKAIYPREIRDSKYTHTYRTIKE